MARQVIRDLAHLIALSSRPDGLECHIELANGLARSSKRIYYLPPTGNQKAGRFEIVNEIDDSEQTLSAKALWTQSNIGQALDKGALILDH